MKKSSHLLEFIIAYIFYLIITPIGFIFYKRKKVWIFCERGDDAKDNSYYFYRWINKNHNEINSYFLIKKCSSDFEKIRSVGKYAYYGSLKHWLLYSASKVRITTHLYSCAPNKFLGSYFLKYSKKKGLDVFLQHGITHNFQDCFFRKNNRADLVICGAKPEYDYLLNNYDLGPEVLKFTGFPRYDTLENKNSDKKIILVQPTWRMWLANLSEEEFIESKYFKTWKSFLENEEIHNVLCETDTQLLFNIHPSLKKYGKLFVESCENIKIIDNSFDIQNLLNMSNLLITDYSSILFDFAYLKKPTIYYHFDSEDFYSKQYQHGFFNIVHDGFGDVCFNEQALVKCVTNCIRLGFKLDYVYKNRIELFFTDTEKTHCLKVYEEIINAFKNKK